jgi:hypothetical protein
MVKELRKTLGRLLVQTPSQSSSAPVTHKAVRTIAIDTLPDDVLLQIFDFCRVGHIPLRSPFPPILEWRRLVQVCRRWRQLIFSSPRRLDLYLFCTYGTPVRKNPGLWPAFPIVVNYINHLNYVNCSLKSLSTNDENNVNAALEHPDRVCYIKLPVTSSLLKNVAQPFPILTHLWLSAEPESGPVLPSSFLGGSAQRLREIYLEGITFPTLSTFLSSASNLVSISLHRIPQAWYISPEVVASLAALTRLDFLSIGFQSSAFHGQSSSRRREALPTRVVFPALTFFGFQGTGEYFEDLMAQIDTPRLASIQIKYFNQHVFQMTQLSRLIGQTQIIEQAHTMGAGVHFYPSSSFIFISALSHGPVENRRISLYIGVSCETCGGLIASQVSHLADVLSQTSVVLSKIRHLSLYAHSLQPDWQNSMDHAVWLAFIRRFTSVETLRVCDPISGHVADALKMAPGILPALYLLHLAGKPEGSVEGFIAARQLCGLSPITIASTASEFLRIRYY